MASIATESSELNNALEDEAIPPGGYINCWRSSWPPPDSVVRLHKPQDNGAVSQAEVLLEIPCHCIPLMEGSKLIKQQLTAPTIGSASTLTPVTSGSAAGVDHDLSSHVQHVTPPADELRVIPLVCPSNLPCNEQGAAAMEAVLRFCYTHLLPDGVTFNGLIHIATAADYLDCHRCSEAVCKALLKWPAEKLTLPDIQHMLNATAKMSGFLQVKSKFCIFELIQPPDGGEQSVDTPLTGMKESWQNSLMALFGNVSDVLKKPQLLQLFTELTLPAITLWGELDRLIVTGEKHGSENNVVALLSYWWSKQPADKQTEHCKQQLSRLIRLPFLSSSYLEYVLEAQPWWQKPDDIPASFKHICRLLQRPTPVNAPASHPKFKGLDIEPRQLDSEQASLEISLSCTLQQVQELANAPVGTRLGCEPLYWQGCEWTVRLTKNHDVMEHPCFHIGLSMKLPEYVQCPEDGVAVTADFSLENTLSPLSGKSQLFEYPSFTHDGQLYGDWGPNVSFDSDDLESELEGKREPDGTLKFTATISNVM